MKVILKEEIKNLGREWDVVIVADGYARNFLLPRNLAMPATLTSVKDLDRRRQKAAIRRQHEEQSARTVAARIAAVSVVLTARSGPEGRLYGSVTAGDIADFFKGRGIEVDRRRIEVGEPIRHVGEHHVDIELYSGVSVHVLVQVNAEGAALAEPAETPATPDEG
jgi:large subunit ribosomal protein L9